MPILLRGWAQWREEAAEKGFDQAEFPMSMPQGLKPTLNLLRLRPD